MEPDERYRLPMCVCPWCNAKNDGATHIGPEDVQPRSGDFSVCMYCSHVVIFVGVAPALTLRKATKADIDQLSPEMQAVIVRAAYASRVVQQERIRRN